MYQDKQTIYEKRFAQIILFCGLPYSLLCELDAFGYTRHGSAVGSLSTMLIQWSK